jgi:hypothetical protein
MLSQEQHDRLLALMEMHPTTKAERALIDEEMRKIIKSGKTAQQLPPPSMGVFDYTTRIVKPESR